MARLTYNINTLKNPEKLKTLNNKMQSRRHNGKVYDPGTESGKQAITILSFDRGCAQTGLKSPTNAHNTIKKLSGDILQVAGIGRARETFQNSSYSLLATQTDTTTISTPTILNPTQYVSIEKRLITLTSIVKNSNDAFFKLDVPISRAKQSQLDKAKEKTIPDYTSLVSSLLTLSANTSTNTIRQFKGGGS